MQSSEGLFKKNVKYDLVKVSLKQNSLEGKETINKSGIVASLVTK